jgi:hypothetical protein
MKKLFTLAVALFTVSLTAQPVMHYSNYIGVGSTGTVFVAPKPSSPGPAGAGVTWNFSSLTFTQVGTAAIMQPSLTPFGSSFPGTNFAVMISMGTNTIYGYNNVQPTINEQIGNNITATGGATYTPNPKTELIFPYSYGGVINDSYQCVACGTSTMTRTYDGYGTLIINGKTFNNVARVTSYFGGSSFYYNYYLTTPVVASIFNYDATGTSSSFFDIGAATSIGETSLELNGLTVYPNPSSGYFKIENLNNREIELEIRNSLGSVVKPAIRISELSENKIDISDLASGLYLVNCRDQNGKAKTMKLVVE